MSVYDVLNVYINNFFFFFIDLLIWISLKRLKMVFSTMLRHTDINN